MKKAAKTRLILDKVNYEELRPDYQYGDGDTATDLAKISAGLGLAAAGAAFIPGGQLLAAGLAGASLVFAAASALYNSKEYGWGSLNFVTSVAGIGLALGLGGVGGLAASQVASNVGKSAIKGIHDTAASLVGWFTA